MTHDLDHDDLDLARHVASKYGPAGDGELESAAMVGLLNASDSFEFGTWRPYAVRCIKWAILDHLRRRIDEPIDTATLPDTAQPIGHREPSDDPRVEQLLVELRAMRAEYLLDGVDRRRMAHRGALVHLKRALT